MNTQRKAATSFPTSAFLTAIIVNAIWVNLSEIFRYFVFIMEMMREAFPQFSDIAPMSVGIFMVWGLWDSILVFSITGFSWLFFERFGYSLRNAVIAGTLFWLAVFVILWLGLLNMNLATPTILMTALPLAWLEMTVAAIIVGICMHAQSTIAARAVVDRC